MYLAMLEKEETKLAFLEMAYLLSITDVKNDNEEYVEEKEENAMLFGMLRVHKINPDLDAEKLNKIKSVLGRKKSEAATLRLYAEELDAFSLDDKDRLQAEIDSFILEVVQRFIKMSETKNEKILSNQDIRVDFIKDAISALAQDNSLFEIPDNQKKVIVFELVGMAYADSEISESELGVIEFICDKLDVDSEFIHDAKDIVAKVGVLQRQGLEIINE